MKWTIFTYVLLFGITANFTSYTQDLSDNDSIRLSKKLTASSNLIYVNSDSAFNIASNVMTEATELKFAPLVIRALGTMAHISTIKGNYTQALRYDISALDLAVSSGDSSSMFIAYNNVGDDQLGSRNYDQAHDNFMGAYNIAIAINDSLGMAISTFNIGLVQKELLQLEEARKNFTKSLQISNQIGDTQGVSFVNLEIGHVSFLESKFDSAKYFYEIALSNLDTIEKPDLKASILERYAMNELHLGNFEDSETAFIEGLDLAVILNNKASQATIYNGLAQLKNYLNELDEAESFLEKSLLLSKSINKKEIESESYRLLSAVDLKRKNYESSLLNFKKYHDIKDSLSQQMNKIQIQNMELQYDLQVMDLEISSLNERESIRVEQLRKQETLTYVFVVLMAVLFVLLIIVYRSGAKRRRANELLLEGKEIVQRQKDELAELNKVKDKFFSILAHDLRSPIRSLSGVLKLLEANNLTPDETKFLIGSIGRKTEQTQRLLDNLLEWTLIQMDKITINKTDFSLNDVIKKNIDLMNETSDKPVSIHSQVNGTRVHADQNMVDLVLRNLLSNAIKYSGDNPEIIISADNDSEQVNIHIADNGIGISEEYQGYILSDGNILTKHATPESKGTGLGLRISREFIERNGGSLWIESEVGKGSIFSFSLPNSETIQQ